MNALAEPLAPDAADTADAARRTPIDGAVYLPLQLVVASPTNPRNRFDLDALKDLAASIKAHGQLQPILARPKPHAKPGGPLYEVVCGERRWRACGLADLPSVMAIVRDMTDVEVLEVQLIENLKRTDLTELEEAEGYRRLLRGADGKQGLQGYANAEELAARIGKSRSYVFQRLKLLDLGPEGRAAMDKGHMAFSVALLVARLKAEDQPRAVKQIVQGWGGEPFTYKQAQEWIHREFHLELDRAVFKITDDTLVPAAGSCRDCPKRTGANPDLFADVKKADTCTDATCYHAKEAAHRARIRAEAEAQGTQVITGAAAKKVKPQQYSPPKGYLELDKVHHNLHDSKPLRKLLAKADVKHVMLEDPHTKGLVEVVPEAEALAALKAAGIIKTAKVPATSAAERDTATRNKRETTWRTAVAAACLDAAAGPIGQGAAYRAGLVGRVAVRLWHELPNDTRVRLTKLLGWPPLKGRWTDGPGTTADQHISRLSADDLCRYLTAVTIAHDTYIASYMGVTKPADLLEAAALLQVDVDAIKASVRDVKRSTPDSTAAQRKAQAAAQLTPETALAQALKTAKPHNPAVKYRCPATGATWSGRGLQPAWLKAALAGGATLASFAVQDVKPTKPAAVLSAAAADPFRPTE